MATYTYRCKACNDVSEFTQKVSDDPKTDCPLCEAKDSLKRIITPGVSFRIGGLGVHKPTSMMNH